MTDVDVLDIAETWSFWDRSPPPSVPRLLELPKTLQSSLCLSIQGVRRCGKSTLLRQLIDRYHLDPRRCAFLNLEDPRLSNALEYSTLDALVEGFRRRHGPNQQLTFFLDEVQNVKGWERWMRAQLDQPRGNVFVITGSNATMLSGRLGTLLTGRHLAVELYPFDIRERRLREPDLTIEQYLDDGGFPEPLAIPDTDRLLRQYFHDIIERDIREHVGARSSLPIRQVVQMAYESAGSELSARRIAGACGVAIETAASYLEACEAAHLLFSVPFFAYSERKRSHRNRKYYPVDTGLRRVVVTKVGADRGKALECAVHLELRRRFRDVFYWRGDGEVDFVVKEADHVVPVQVSWDRAQARHERALASFYEHFPHADEALRVTAYDFERIDALLGRAPA